ncbi:MFS transporter [Salinibacterium sp. NK8237]|uniref:MFS transporter n=1 Tax=Salinibacterium sp. NK8237 TaxID=2792038 RepID=UPI0018CF1624|nr:MFS transporter [Salinibacterium sp. NK8237]MBH0130675.1 MFS transporter [Salinibacterium sp. NK8237]
MSAMFRSLRLFNYRLWIIGAVVSNTGAWMQRTAQDWIVLTDLTDYDAAALGFTMALQFGPMLLLMPLTGIIADRFDRRTVLLWTQFSQFALALGLGILVISGHVQLWQVYVFALLLGVATAIDAPARQAFVSELVSDKDLPNAVALNSMSFQTARLIGPAVAGVLVAAIGAGPVFIVNAASFAGVLASLWFMRRGQLFPVAKLGRAKGQIRDGLRYVRGRPDILIVLVMVFLVGTFGFNFPVFIATMSTGVFGKGAAEFGLLSSMMAVGAVVGSLLAARRERARFGVVIVGSAFFGLACLLAAFAPSYWTFGAALTIIGVFSLTMMTTANAYVQTSTTPIMRGRVMALYLAIFAGGTPIGAPIVGWAANELGPRWALGIGALSGLLAAAAAIIWLVYSRGMRVGRVPESRFRLRLRFPPEPTPDEERELATQEIAIVETTTRRTS